MASFVPMPLAFNEWKRKLLDSAGSAGPPVRRMGDYVLELLWKDGCEPTISSLLDYAQGGLCNKFGIRASDNRSPESVQADPQSSGPTPR